MAVHKTTEAVNILEDLSKIIHKITPEETPFYTSIKKDRATSTYHEFLSRELAPANADNAMSEGAPAPEAVASLLGRKGNWTQIFSKTAEVSGTLDAVSTVGYDKESTEQIAVKTAEIKLDIEKALTSANASVGGSTRKLGGLEAWISSNVNHGAGGSTPGFASGLVGTVTNGTTRKLTEAMFTEMAESLYEAGGKAKNVLASAPLKSAISGFSGNASKQAVANKEATIYAGVDIYVSNFGTFSIIPHREMSKTTVIAYDPDLWAVAELRKLKGSELAKTGDKTSYQLVTELTLTAKNEKGNAKISDVTAI